jgi:hypothetical protein
VIIEFGQFAVINIQTFRLHRQLLIVFNTAYKYSNLISFIDFMVI